MVPVVVVDFSNRISRFMGSVALFVVGKVVDRILAGRSSGRRIRSRVLCLMGDVDGSRDGLFVDIFHVVVAVLVSFVGAHGCGLNIH